MKRYNTIDKNMWLVVIVVPILLFFVSMNATYAYFTATAREQTASGTTAIIRIEMSEDTGVMVNTAKYASQLLVPGDTIKYDGTLKNTGTAPVYAIMKLKTEITASVASNNKTLVKYFTYLLNETTQKNEWQEVSIVNNAFDKNCFTLANGASLDFAHAQEFVGSDYGSEYMGASVKFTVSAFSIQTANITQANATVELYNKIEPNESVTNPGEGGG